MNRAFAALRVFGVTLRVLAWIVLILGLVLAIVALVVGFLLHTPLGIPWLHQSPELVGAVVFLVVLVLSVLSFLTNYAAAEFINLMLSIEDNTRRMAYILQQQYLGTPTPYAEAPASGDLPGLEGLEKGS